MTRNHKKALKLPITTLEKVLMVITVLAILVTLCEVLASIRRPSLIEQADNTRKTDIVNTITEFMDDALKKNKGKFPGGNSNGAFTRSDFTDPDGTQYKVVIEELLTGETKEVKTFNHTVYVYTHATCDGGVARYSENPRRYAIVYYLESGEPFCHKDSDEQDEAVVFDTDIEVRNKQIDKDGKTIIAAFLEQNCEFRYDYKFDSSARLITSDGRYVYDLADFSNKYNVVKGQTRYSGYSAASCDAVISGKYNTKDVARIEIRDGSTDAFMKTVDAETGEFTIQQTYHIMPDLIGAPTGESQLFRLLFIDKYDNVVTQVTFLYNVKFSEANKKFIKEWRRRIDNQ